MQLIHYCCQTDLGLLQGNVLAATAMGKEHWWVRVMVHAGVPIHHSTRRTLKEEQVRLIEQHQARRTTAAKRQRSNYKRERAKTADARKDWRPPADMSQPEFAFEHRYHSEIAASDQEAADAATAAADDPALVGLQDEVEPVWDAPPEQVPLGGNVIDVPAAGAPLNADGSAVELPEEPMQELSAPAAGAGGAAGAREK